MPEKIKFTQQYVDELPMVDTLCPICKTGYIRSGKYSPLCLECHSAFRLSNTSSKAKPPEIKIIPISRLDPKDKEEILGTLRELYKQGIEIKEMLKALHKVDIYYPENKGEKPDESYLETKPHK